MNPRYRLERSGRATRFVGSAQLLRPSRSPPNRSGASWSRAGNPSPPDLLADRDIARVNDLFILWATLSRVLPGVIGGLVTMSWAGALTAFFWGGLVRVALLHHVT